jgi:hypothetical protein
MLQINMSVIDTFNLLRFFALMFEWVWAVCGRASGLWAWASGYGWFSASVLQDAPYHDIWSRAAPETSVKLHPKISWEWIGLLPGEVDAASSPEDAESSVDSALVRLPAWV